jgi:hypothetical protein
MSIIAFRARNLAFLLLVSLVRTPASAYAVDPAGLQSDASPPDDRDPQIQVTGSRIRRDRDESAEPLVILNGDYLRDRALTNLADALNEQS